MGKQHLTQNEDGKSEGGNTTAVHVSASCQKKLLYLTSEKNDFYWRACVRDESPVRGMYTRGEDGSGQGPGAWVGKSRGAWRRTRDEVRFNRVQDDPTPHDWPGVRGASGAGPAGSGRPPSRRTHSEPVIKKTVVCQGLMSERQLHVSCDIRSTGVYNPWYTPRCLSVCY